MTHPKIQNIGTLVPPTKTHLPQPPQTKATPSRRKNPSVMWIASSKGTSQVIIDSHASSWPSRPWCENFSEGWVERSIIGNLQPSKFGKPRTTKHLKQKSPINLYSFLKIFLIPSWFFQFGCCLNLKVHGVCIGTPNIIPFSPSSRHSPRPSSQHSLQW